MVHPTKRRVIAFAELRDYLTELVSECRWYIYFLDRERYSEALNRGIEGVVAGFISVSLQIKSIKFFTPLLQLLLFQKIHAHYWTRSSNKLHFECECPLQFSS